MGSSEITRNWRNFRPRFVLIVSVLLASSLVLLALPGRQIAERTSTDAFIPFRNLTAFEASVLLRCPASSAQTAIVSASETEVVVVTAYYVIAADPQARVDPQTHCDHRTVTRANWAAFYSRYQVPRRELERALGHEVQIDGARAARFAGYRLSFDSRLVPVYVAGEIAFLSAWFSLFGLALRRVRRLSLALPLTWLWLVLPIPFVRLYSPAFYDGDWFYQRVVVERIALWSVLGAMALAVPAGLSLLIYATLRGAEAFARRRAGDLPPAELTRVYRRRAWFGLLALALCFVLVRSGDYWFERHGCLEELGHVRPRLTQPNLSAAVALERGSGGNLARQKGIPDATRSAIEAILEDRAATGRELVVLVPTGRAVDEFVFLWRHGSNYADVRTVPPNFGRLIDASFLASLGPDASCSVVFESLRSKRIQTICGQRVRVGDREVTVAVKSARKR